MGCQYTKCESKGDPMYRNQYIELVKEQIKTHSVMVYSRTVCVHSVSAKATLTQYSIPYEFFDLDNISESNSVLEALQNLTGKQGTPFIFVQGQFIGGLKDLRKRVSSEHQLLF